MVRYKVTLTREERDYLLSILKKGRHKSKEYRKALILLNCDEGENSDKVTNQDICKVLKIGMRTIDRLKKRFVEEGLEEILEEKKSKRVYRKKIDGDLEARIIALSCSDPPEGYSRWSLRLLADKVVELHYVDNISYETIRKALKKTNYSLGKVNAGLFPRIRIVIL